MEQVRGYRGGERDYAALRGGTGPLVYPAGFVRLFDGLQQLTRGDVRAAQVRAAHSLTQLLAPVCMPPNRLRDRVWDAQRLSLTNALHNCPRARGTCACCSSCTAMQVVFAGLFVLTQALAMRLYIVSEATPPWALALLALSKRMHSIFLLRLFNDCWAMMLAYLAMNLLTGRHWAAAVFAFAISVSVKMNGLLFAPGVLAVCIAVRFLKRQTWGTA
jgi:alpha-1,3-mannosyltransferase